MNILLKRKIFVIPLIVVMAVAVFGGVIYAATAITVPGQVNIVVATNDIEVYSNSRYTVELTEIIWNDLPVGGEKYRIVYIRNIGNTDAQVVATLQGAPAGVTLREGADTIVISRRSQAAFTLYLEAATTANIGSSSFTVTFTSTPIYVNP